jgi:hypothetical protein
MCNTAAHLTDRVFPDVPIRQWVLSVPFELRLLLARNAAALSAVGRIFVREIWRWQREQFGASLVRARNAEASRTPNIRGGAVCFPQRFGGSLNLNVHYHVAVPDGVFSREHQGAQGVVFHQLPIPNRSDLEAIGHAVELRVLNWLRRRSLLDADEAEQPDHDAERQRDALDACLRGSLGIGELSSLPGSEIAAGQGTAEDSPGPNPRSLTGGLASRGARSSRGFDIHAGVSVSRHDREGRERLLRYCARPPLSLERLSVLADGRVAYRIKNPRGRQTHRVMSPIQFLARLCALIPPPRHPLVRFHGVFAPHSSWRRHVVALASGKLAADRDAKAMASGNGAVRGHDPNRDARLVSARPVESGAPTALGAGGRAAIFPPAEIAVAHDTRIDWATLLKRVHDIDALACPCGGRLRVIALITEPEVVVAILISLHLPAVAPPVARARSPDDYDPVSD